MHFRSKKRPILLLMLSILVFGCGSLEMESQEWEGTGSIALNVNWQGAPTNSADANLNMAAALDCAASSVATVSAYVYNSSNTLLASGGPWACTVHVGSISNVPAGSNYTVRLEGLNSGGAVTWRGEVTGISVTSGQTTNAGITMSYVGSTILASGVNLPCAIVVDSNSVYWTENATTGGSVKQVSISGGTATTLASGLNAATGGAGCLAFNVMVDTASVYWGEASTVYNGNDAAVRKAPISGGTVTTLASGRNQLAGIATDSTNVYFAETGLSKVSKVAKGGGTITMLGNMWNYPIGIAVDSTNVYGAVNNNWWAGNGSVQKISINGGTATTLASGLNAPFSIAVDNTNVYWTDYHVYNGGNAQQSDGTGAVKKVSVNGGTVTTLATGLNRPNQIVVDSTSGYVYWTETGTYTGDTLNNGTGAVKKVSISGGTVITLASGLNYPYSGIAVDSTNVYWSEHGTSTNGVYNANSGAIKKMPK